MGRIRSSFAILVIGAAVLLVAGACTQPGGGNQAPKAVFTATPNTGLAPLDVVFDSTGSSDDVGIVSYQWDFGDGSPLETTANATHTYATPGTYTAKLTVKDVANATGTKTQLITVNPPANVPPVADAQGTNTSGKEPLVVSFVGSGSTDSDGNVVSHLWDFGDGSPTSAVADTSHTYVAAGDYIATLTVTDDDGAENTDTVAVHVDANQPPTAQAGADTFTGKIPLTVAFNSTGSSDLDGTFTTSWDFGDGGTSTDADPTHTYTVAGTYNAVLTVTDDNGATDTATVTITANANQAPTAVANATPTAGQVPLTIAFVGGGSTDADGSIVGYSWDFGDSNTANTADVSHTYGATGTYNAVLTVTDDNGATDTASITIDVNPVPNVPPTAVASCVPTSGKEPLTVVCNSSGSSDSDGTIVGWQWDFGDGYTANTASASHAIAAAGNYTVTLTVTDNAGGQSTDTVDVTVNANQPPTADANGTPTSGKEPLLVAFSSGGSSDPDGTFTTSWDFGDGGSSTAANPTHTYAAAGSYTAVLTVTDDNGATDTASVAITVNANQAPTAVANANPQSGPETLAVSFDSSSSADPDGSINSIGWDFGDGGTSTDANPTHNYAAGSYTATLTVTDDNGVADTDTIAVTVWVDADGDTYRPTSTPNSGAGPYDCNDGDAAVNPGAADPLDAGGVDSNCDGYDGVAANSAFVSIGGSDIPTCGTASAPCLTIATGIAQAVAANKTVLQVGSGTYTESVTLSAPAGGLTIRGGYATPGGPSDFTTRSGVTTINGSGGSAAVTGGGSTTPITVADLTINGPSGGSPTGVLVSGASDVTLLRVTVNSGSSPAVGGSTYGVRAVGGATVTVTDSTVSASAAGAAPAAGASGPDAGGGCGGNPGSLPGAGGACGSGVGLGGAGGAGGNGCAVFDCPPKNGADGNNGGGGAAKGNGGTGGCTGANGGLGGTGGTAGAAGSGGSKATNSLSNTGATWAGATAGSGGTGGNGGGGGGAGGGGGTCASVKGGGGGGGGGGGLGATGGSPGATGGGSFAVYNHDSTVTVTNSVLTSAAGGAGSAGGNGGKGGNGGNGGSGGSTNTDLQAGSGGGGGGGAGGGAGGGGGGGAGGPSVTAFHAGSGTLTISSTTLTVGSGGTAGSGGSGGVISTGGSGGTRGNANDGQHGANGTAGGSSVAGNAGVAGDAGQSCSTYDAGVCTP